MREEIAVLSGTAATVKLIPDILASGKVKGAAFHDEFVRQVKALPRTADDWEEGYDEPE